MEGACKKGLLEYAITRKSNPPPFLLKTYMLVDDPATDAAVSWNEDGTAFVVWQPAEFASDLLPTLFKHCNFSSFVRQLNTYGFRKAATNRWEFCNKKFQKGKKELLSQIRRRKAWTYRQQPSTTVVAVAPPTSSETLRNNNNNNHDEDQRSSSTSSSSELTTLVDENKRLKKENGTLNLELTTMKKRCKKLLDLVAIYSNSNSNSNEKIQDNNDNGCDNDENFPKLFGVRLQVQGEIERKRKRSEEVYEMARLLLSHSCK